jgi:hypothetical protein
VLVQEFSGFRRAGVAWALAMSLVCAGPGRGWTAGEPGAEQKAEAGAHLRRGAELIDREDLPSALAEFEAAYRLVPSPAILHDFGIVYQGLGRRAAALDAFERFLDQAKNAPPSARAHAERAVETLRPQVARLQVVVDLTGASIVIDGRTVAQTPQEKPIYLDPGPHQLVVEKAGRTPVHTQRLDVAAGEHLTVAARLAVAPPTPLANVALESQTKAGQAGSTNHWQRPAAWATAAAASVAAGLFATTLVMRHRRVTDFNDKGCGTDNPSQYDPACPSLLERADDADGWAKLSGAATGLLGVGSALLFWTLPAPALQVSLRAAPAQMNFALRGRF